MLTYHPVVSVILPICNATEAALRRSFESVLAQLYEIAAELGADPAPDILYSDCDQIDDSQKRSSP
jgi:hypothetical protein